MFGIDFRYDFDGLAWLFLVIAIAIVVYSVVQTVGPFWVYSAFGGFRWYYALIVIGILLAAFVATNIIPFIVSFNNDHARGVTSVELAKHFDFESGHPYPLLLSSETAPGQATDGGYFTTNDRLDSVPVDDLELEFKQDQRFSPIDMPRYAVDYAVGGHEQTTIAISLDGKLVDESTASYKVEYGGCDFYFLNLWLQCDRQVVSREMIIGDNARLTGLGQIVERHQNGALILLSPEDYESREE